MDVQPAPTSSAEHFEISRRLKRFHLAEGVPLAGNRQVLRVVGGDENTRGSDRLVELPVE
jgi:hypothetical protein